jgi:hypothetical protein
MGAGRGRKRRRRRIQAQLVDLLVRGALATLICCPLYIGNRSDNEYKVKHSCVDDESG